MCWDSGTRDKKEGGPNARLLIGSLKLTFFAKPAAPLTNPKKSSKIIESPRHLNHMSFNKDSAVAKARQDLAKRLKVKESDIEVASVSEKDFPDMSLGAPAKDEMSGQMISSGWQIRLNANGKNYEYRADKHQLRLKDFDGANHVI